MTSLPVPLEGLQYGAALFGREDASKGAVLPHLGCLRGVGNQDGEDSVRTGVQGGAPEI
jgi:hypothetical protein